MGIAERFEAIEERIRDACARVGRDPAEVRLLPVSKTRPASELAEAARLGYRRFGENKVQEVVAKAAELDGAGIEFAVIGHLQTNKAKQVAELAVEFQALDSHRIAEALDRRLQALGRSLDVCVQVNSSGEDTKSGLAPDEVVEFAKGLDAYHSLRVTGLMTLAHPDPARARQCFATMVDVQRRLRDASAAGSEWHELSMGMSGDFTDAIAAGATCVRIGTALFGPRA